MVNKVVNCSGMRSVLFHERSVNVRTERTTENPCSTRSANIFMYVCSVCSVFLDPSVSCVFVFSVFGYRYCFTLFLTVGLKSTEQIEQSLVKHSTNLIPQGFNPVLANRTFSEQNQNTVRNRAEQFEEQVRKRESSNTSAVRFSVPVCSGLFGLLPNTQNPYITSPTGRFL